MANGYGLISETDAKCIEKTIDLIQADIVSVLEIGLFNCETSKGIKSYIESKGKKVVYTGIDNQRDKKIDKPDWMWFILGNSSEVYNEIANESKHLVFIDGLHTFPGVVSDFYCYSQKVKRNGFIVFHDTGFHIDPLHGWQGVGRKDDPDMCLGGVRKALKKIGLLDNKFPGWRLVFDEADVKDLAGGVCVFKKI